MTRLHHWLGYMKRTLLGRPPWDAAREFSYYVANQHLVRQHRATQEHLEREVFVTGLSIVRALGVLDARLLQGARILEIGAGECAIAEAMGLLAGAGEVWATDAIPKQIWAAAEKHGNHPRLRFLIADARELPFADGQFDLAVGNLVLHHIHPLEDVLAEVFRTLVPGGRFAAFEPNPLLGPLVHDKTSENEAPVSPQAIRRAAERVGFVETTYEYWWTRLGTSKAGAISPGYRFHGRKPGGALTDADGQTVGPARHPVSLRRPVHPTRMPGLEIDSSCKFAALANDQLNDIAALSGLGSASQSLG